MVKYILKIVKIKGTGGCLSVKNNVKSFLGKINFFGVKTLILTMKNRDLQGNQPHLAANESALCRNKLPHNHHHRVGPIFRMNDAKPYAACYTVRHNSFFLFRKWNYVSRNTN